MRILYTSPRYTSHDRNFLRSLAASEHEIWFLSLQGDDGALEERPLPEGVSTVCMGKRPGGLLPVDMLGVVPGFLEILRQVRPAVVHAGPVQSGGFLAALGGFHPLLVASWGSDILVDAGRDDLMRWATEFTLRSADAFLCDCNTVRAAAREIVPLEEESIVQFPWGVDHDLFFPGRDAEELRSRLGWEDAVVVLSTRSFEKIYGVEVLIEAFAAARRRLPRLRLILAGDGSLGPRINDRILELGLEGFVHRPGRVVHSRLPDLFRASDIYMSCCFSDGSSVSLLEAMATGLLVIVTDTGGNRDWVRHRENGWLCPPGDPAVFAQCLMEATELDDAGRRDMSKKNLETARAKADWNRNFGSLLAAYERAAGRAREGHGR